MRLIRAICPDLPIHASTQMTLTSSQTIRLAQELGLVYVHIPFSAGSPDPKVIDQFLAAIAVKANQPVFVHCASAQRVGTVWLAKRVLQDNYSIEKASEEAHAIGLSNPGLEKFALQYIADHKK